MTLVIGTDEAGYGPNLGPLVVAATAWAVTENDEADDAAHADRFARAAGEIGAANGGAAPWGDSKRLYQRGAGLDAIEAGVLAALGELSGDGFPGDGAALEARLGSATDDLPPEWPRFRAHPLPVAVDRGRLDRLVAAVPAALSRQGLRLAAVRCRVVHPRPFNALLDTGHNKSDILSATTLDLAATIRAEVATATAAVPGGEPVVIWCDRHGGRKAYAALVGRHFSCPLVRTLAETPRSSRYAVPTERLTIEFAVGGESTVPVALASMTAKYVRELAMLAFNRHWTSLCPGLVPTAGYPLDARRWWADAAAAVRAAGIDRDAVWRRA
ncbi:MAG: hypothetical protein ACKOCW_07170 [Planctomycetaceae bacterium]